MNISADDLIFIEDRLAIENDVELKDALAALHNIINNRREALRLEKEARARNSCIKYSRNSGGSSHSSPTHLSVTALTPASTFSFDPDDEYVPFTYRFSSPEKYEEVVRRKRRVKNISAPVHTKIADDEKMETCKLSPSMDAMKKLFSDLKDEVLLCEEPARKKPKVDVSLGRGKNSEAKKRFAWPSKRVV